MKSFAVIGLGRFGSSVARRLCELGGEVLAIDDRLHAVENISDYVTQAVSGDCTDERVLSSLVSAISTARSSVSPKISRQVFL